MICLNSFSAPWKATVILLPPPPSSFLRLQPWFRFWPVLQRKVNFSKFFKHAFEPVENFSSNCSLHIEWFKEIEECYLWLKDDLIAEMKEEMWCDFKRSFSRLKNMKRSAKNKEKGRVANDCHSCGPVVTSVPSLTIWWMGGIYGKPVGRSI